MDTTAPTPITRRTVLVAVVALLAVLAGSLGVVIGASAPAGAAGPYTEFGNGLAIPDSGPANPFPSAIPDVRRGQILTGLHLNLIGVHHSCAKDVDIALVHGGRRTLLLSDVGEQALSVGCHDIHIPVLTIDDACPPFPTPIPVENRTEPGVPLCARPTDVDGSGHEADTMPAPETQGAYADPLYFTFGDVDARGSWALYVNDDAAGSAGSIQWWQLHIATSDRPPTAVDTTTFATKGSPVPLALEGSDHEDGEYVSCRIVTDGRKGTTTPGQRCGATYVARPLTSGDDTITYVTVDSAGNESPPATATVRIVNRPPVATPVDLTIRAGATVALPLGGTDPDPQESVRCTQVSAATRGVLEGSGCTRSYRAGDVLGEETLTYTVSDDFGAVAQGTIRLRITSNAPVAHAKEVTAPKGSGWTGISMSGTDPDGLPYGCEVDAVTAQRKGTLTGVGCERGFTPKPGTDGTDTFTYLIRNSRGVASARATVTITIPNRAPQAPHVALAVLPGETVGVTLPGGDADGDPVSCSVLTTPALGRLEGTGCERTYVAGPEQGTETLRYRVTDPSGATGEGTAEVRIEDLRPTAPPVAVTGQKGTPVTFTLGAPRQTCEIATTTAQGKGALTIDGCTGTFRADARTSGTDTFTYTVRDTNDRVSTPGTVTVTIQNRTPVAPTQAITVLPGDSAAVVLGGTDPDPGEGVALGCTPTTGPTARGRVSGSGCFATYTAGSTAGTDSFAYTVRDPFGATATGRVEVTIAGTAPAGCTPSDPQDARYVCRTYTDLLGRPADASGKTYWLGRLGRGESRAAIIKAFTGTPEYRTSVVRGIWRAYLGTTPDAATTQRWVEQLGRGANPDLVRQEALASTAFQDRAGATPEGFVAGLHQQLLRRPATTAEVTTIAAQLRAGTTRATVVTRLLATTEADTATVAAIYERFLRRSPPAAETAYWVGRLQRGESELALVRLIVASAEYHGRA
ncbi:MAG TPA: Ig-like domain-containing protein [Iamia sp.]